MNTDLSLLTQCISVLGQYLIYLAVCVTILVICRIMFTIPQPVFRKMLHFVAMTSVPYMIYVSENWQPVVIIAVIFIIAVYPLLALGERWSGFHHFFAEKRNGEIKRSLVDAFGTHAVVALVLYGLLDMPYAAIAAILTWGAGDTAAAFFGIKFGRHKIPFRHADQKKSWEGTLGNAAVSFLVCLGVLLWTSPFSPAKCVLLSLVAAPVSAGAELFTKNGNDTITVPLALGTVLAVLGML